MTLSNELLFLIYFQSENRYRVPKGTKFFRVKLGVVNNPSTSKDLPQNTYQSTKPSAPLVDVMSQSHSIIDSTMIDSTIIEKFGGTNSLPSSPPKHHPVIFENDEHDVTITAECIPSTMEQLVTHKPTTLEQHFAEDSGIVENIESNRAALSDYQNKCESSDRQVKEYLYKYTQIDMYIVHTSSRLNTILIFVFSNLS